MLKSISIWSYLFQSFKLDLSMSKKDCTLIELMNDLKAAETILKPVPVVHLTQGKSSHSNYNPKRKGSKKKD